MNDILTAADFEKAVQVKPATIGDWLKAVSDFRLDVPRVTGEKSVPLKAMPPAEWALVAA